MIQSEAEVTQSMTIAEDGAVTGLKRQQCWRKFAVSAARCLRAVSWPMFKPAGDKAGKFLRPVFLDFCSTGIRALGLRRQPAVRGRPRR